MATPSKIPGLEGLETEAADFHRLLGQEKSDLARVLLSLAFIDLCLASLLKEFLIDGETSKRLLQHTGVLGAFHARADMAYCLGLIPKGMLQNLRALSEMRNSFAHSHLSLSFDDKDVISHCEKLTIPKSNATAINSETGKSRETDEWHPSMFATPRDRFVLIAALIADSLMRIIAAVDKRSAMDEWLPPKNWFTMELPSDEWEKLSPTSR